MLDIGDEVIIGNITTQSLSDIWNSDKAKTLAFPSEDLYVNSPCHGCEDFAFCQAKGMCYVGAKLNFGKIFYPTGHCKVLRGKIVVDR